MLLKIISVLENGNEPVSSNLSGNQNGQFSLSIQTPAKVKKKVKSVIQRPQDMEKAALEGKISTYKKKSPAWGQKAPDQKQKKSGTSAAPKPSNSAVSDQ